MQFSVFTILPLLLSSAAAAALDTAEVREARSLDQSSSPNNVGGGLLPRRVDVLLVLLMFARRGVCDRFCSGCGFMKGTNSHADIY
ncbi:hypothetical protein CPAR01_02871 [Colletotrichum paranaense]|uniref:Secreted protein n=1 Tax=Colletotrichum paranaense TaxID=1914294 RepID=A0ABQ9T0V2_9PEZI|nr:uncharacterized protein CPAR01_02871 [Colletotrichum paranaense]KAK1545369.1 hypothetical protein CPAR01_02871 [Colletotrichum paranaense]